MPQRQPQQPALPLPSSAGNSHDHAGPGTEPPASGSAGAGAASTPMSSTEFLAQLAGLIERYEDSNYGAVCGVLVSTIEQVSDSPWPQFYEWDGKELANDWPDYFIGKISRADL